MVVEGLEPSRTSVSHSRVYRLRHTTVFLTDMPGYASSGSRTHVSRSSRLRPAVGRRWLVARHLPGNDSGQTRTANRQVRGLVLFPVELRHRMVVEGLEPSVTSI